MYQIFLAINETWSTRTALVQASDYSEDLHQSAWEWIRCVLLKLNEIHVVYLRQKELMAYPGIDSRLGAWCLIDIVYAKESLVKILQSGVYTADSMDSKFASCVTLQIAPKIVIDNPYEPDIISEILSRESLEVMLFAQLNFSKMNFFVDAFSGDPQLINCKSLTLFRSPKFRCILQVLRILKSRFKRLFPSRFSDFAFQDKLAEYRWMGWTTAKVAPNSEILSQTFSSPNARRLLWSVRLFSEKFSGFPNGFAISKL